MARSLISRTAPSDVGRTLISRTSISDTRPKNYLKMPNILSGTGYCGFSATSQYINPLNDFSWSLMWRPWDKNYQFILRNTGGTSNGYMIDYQSTAKGFFSFRLKAGYIDAGTPGPAAIVGYWSATSNPTMEPFRYGRWYHLAFVVDRSAYMTFYVNGVPTGTPVDISTLDGTSIGPTVAANLTLESTSANTCRCADFARLAHYTRVITAAEVLEIYNGADPSKLADCTGWYPCEEAGNTLNQPASMYIWPSVGIDNGFVYIGRHIHETQNRLPADATRLLKIGLFSDMHNGTDGVVAPLSTAVAKWNDEQVDAVISLGDNISGANGATAASGTALATMQGYIQSVITELDVSTAVLRRTILGNHDVDGELVTADTLAEWQSFGTISYYDPAVTGLNYWSEDLNDAHLVFLDCTDRSEDALDNHKHFAGAIGTTETSITLDSVDEMGQAGAIAAGAEVISYTGISGTTLTGCVRGAFGTTAGNHANLDLAYDNRYYFTLSDAQLTWLENDLQSTTLPTIVFVHARVDQDYPGMDGLGVREWITADTPPFSVFVFNSNALRTIMEKYGRVKLVLSGHEHDTHYGMVNGIHYLNIGSLLNTSWATMNFYSDGTFDLQGDGTTTKHLSYPRR